MIEGHGDDIYRYGGKVKYNFSSNIFSGVDHSGLMRHISSLGDRLKYYPEPEARSLEQKIASAAGINSDEVLVTNGAMEAIYLIAMHLRGTATQIIAPAFREYQDACRIHGVAVDFISEISGLCEDAPSVWLCNPSNPTGHVTDISILKDAICRFPDKLFVIDQAYAAYSVLPVMSHEEAVNMGNVILLSSLTKDYAVPGLRIGYAVGNNHILNRLRMLRMPWSVNSIAIEAAYYLLNHKEEYRIDASSLHKEALLLASGFRELRISVSDTDCNFILCELPPGNRASDLKRYLIENHGILIRDASNFQTLNERHFRVAAQSPDTNRLLLSAIRQYLSRDMHL